MKRKANLKTSIIITLVLFIALFAVIKYQQPMFLAFTATSIVTFISILWHKISLDGLFTKMLHDAKNILPIIYVLGSIGTMIAAWMHSGVLAACMDFGLVVLPNFNLVLAAFILTSALSMILGTAVGTMGTIGMIFILLARTFNVPVPLVAGAVISGCYFGDRTSPMSSSVNLTAKVSGVELGVHIINLLKTSIIPMVISTIVYYFWGSGYQINQAMLNVLNQQRTLLQSHFSLSFYHYIPVIVLLAVIVIFRKHIIVAVWSSILSAFAIAIFDGVGFTKFVHSMIFGYMPSNQAIADLFSGSGFVSMFLLFCFLISASVLNTLFDHMGYFEPFFSGLDGRLTTDFKRVFGAGMVAYMVMLLSGNQSLPAIVAAGRYHHIFDEKGIDKKWLSTAISDFMIIQVPLPPWNINAVLVYSIIGVSSLKYLPFAILSLVMPLTSTIHFWVKMHKFT